MIIERLHALLMRMDTSHSAYPLLTNDVAMKLAGQRGEASLDYHLHFLKQQWNKLKGVRLKGDEFYFQIDTILVVNSALILIEVKNMTGELEYDEPNHQLIQKLNDTVKCYPDPFLQVKRQAIQLRKWLQQHNFPHIPIETFVVFTNRSAILKSSNPFLFHSTYLPFKLNSMDLPPDVWTNQNCERFITQCENEHVPEDYDVLEKYNVRSNELRKGVLCIPCNGVQMEKVYGGWTCPGCGAFSEIGHLQALEHHYLLIGDRITNKEFREFAGISSKKSAQRLLTSLDLPRCGGGRSIYYQLNWHQLQNVRNSASNVRNKV